MLFRSGIYWLAKDGKREFVMNNQSTKSAESIIGGQLTQQSLLSALSSMNAAKNNVQYVDNSRFSPGVSARERRQYKREMVALIEGLIGG